jgi:hypothetical protein
VLEFKDVELRIRAAKSGGDGRPSVHDVEVRVDGSGLWNLRGGRDGKASIERGG